MKYNPENFQRINDEYIDARTVHRKLVRKYRAEEAINRDSKTFEILSSNSKPVFKRIRATKRNIASKINK